MSFFERTPIGRILNRFSSDVSSLDTILPVMFMSLLVGTINVIGSAVLIAIITPWSLIAWIILGGVYAGIQVWD